MDKLHLVVDFPQGTFVPEPYVVDGAAVFFDGFRRDGLEAQVGSLRLGVNSESLARESDIVDQVSLFLFELAGFHLEALHNVGEDAAHEDGHAKP